MEADELTVLLNEARNLADSGSIDEAILRYRNALEIAPENPTSWYCLGVLLVKSDSINDAIDAFENCDKIVPNHGPTLSNLSALLESIDPEKSSEYATAALIHYPDNPKLQELSVNFVKPESEPARIFIQSRAVIDDGENDEPLYDAGPTSLHQEAEELSETGNHGAAVALWKGILENSPNSPEVWRGLANALLSAGYPDRYEQCNMKARSLEERQAQSNDLEILEIESPELSLLEAAEEINQNPVENDDSGDIDEAISWYNMGTNLLIEGNHDEALTCFEKAIGGCPIGETDLRMKAQTGRGNALFNQGRYPESIISYHAAIGINPANVSGRMLFNMGSSYAAVEMFDDAIKCFNQALSMGLDKSEAELCEKQVSRCRLLSREQAKRQARASR
jgi:tetratricopeptide (TPR) repeat protein